jgi:hypothetical protein
MDGSLFLDLAMQVGGLRERLSSQEAEIKQLREHDKAQDAKIEELQARVAALSGKARCKPLPSSATTETASGAGPSHTADNGHPALLQSPQRFELEQVSAPSVMHPDIFVRVYRIRVTGINGDFQKYLFVPRDSLQLLNSAWRCMTDVPKQVADKVSHLVEVIMVSCSAFLVPLAIKPFLLISAPDAGGQRLGQGEVAREHAVPGRD